MRPFLENMEKVGLFVQKEDVFVFDEEEKELAKIKAIIPGSKRRQLMVRVNSVHNAKWSCLTNCMRYNLFGT